MVRSPLFRKYAAVLVLLVGGALLLGGAAQGYFAYRQSQEAQQRLEREEAAAAAARIESFLAGTRDRVADVVDGPFISEGASLEDREAVYEDLVRANRPGVYALTYIDSDGTERLHAHGGSIEDYHPGADRSRDPEFLVPKSGKTYYGPVFFQGPSTRPHMKIGLHGPSVISGVTVLELNLVLVQDLISQIQVGTSGHAYVVDSTGLLVAHPDVRLVFAEKNLASVPQVRDAVANRAPREGVSTARGLTGAQVLTAYQRIDPFRLYVFVEQPLDEAFAPVYASVELSAVIVLMGVVIAVLAGLWLARRLVSPIRVLQAGTGRIAKGDLEQRIDVRTGDELEDLAGEFNQMTARLQESYTTLERRVAERTHDLEAALEQQMVTGEVLNVISRSTFDLQPVLDTVVANATQLCDAEKGFIVLLREDGRYHLAASHNATPEFRSFIEENPIPPGRGSLVGRTALENRVVHITDAVNDPEYTWTESQQLGRFRSMLGVPMLREGLVIGVIAIWREEVAPFSEKLIGLVSTFADQAVIALENTRLFQELESKNRELEVASRHKSEFLANMSHELRTPLNAIIGFSEVLHQRMAGDINEKQSEYLEDVLSSGHHLLSLINDILDLSKVEAGRMELELDRFSLPEAIDNGLTLVRERAGRSGISLETAIDPGLSVIEADQRKFKQILFNLLSNAVKFTPSSGTVRVGAERHPHEVRVWVSDTGPGIPLTEQARIFEEFEQVRRDGSGATEGTGLGLALARKFVELHGGRIWVDSEEGRGSTFTFTLPRQVARSSQRARREKVAR